ncbi:MAG: ThiF family adenylyltransferase [Chloroflexi bacterium]|nr:ThiF family adenylyltransferase [Chloroflexota bacterium]
MHRLDNSFTQRHFTVTVVGCGGTGGFVAEGLCRLLPRHAGLALIDHDRVEEENLTRQNFTREDLGRFKSEALARRLARKHGRTVAYAALPVGMVELALPGIVIGGVDNGLARRDIAARLKGFSTIGLINQGYVSRPNWWVDAGNGENYGQILIGNADRAIFEKDVCYAMPLPTLQRPELLAQAPSQEPSCVQIAEQGPTMNLAMAAVVLEVVRRLIEGTCPWMQLYLDLAEGTLHSVPATPGAVTRILGIKKQKIIQKGGGTR